jgi:hypothetical protein
LVWVNDTQKFDNSSGAERHCRRTSLRLALAAA